MTEGLVIAGTVAGFVALSKLYVHAQARYLYSPQHDRRSHSAATDTSHGPPTPTTTGHKDHWMRPPSRLLLITQGRRGRGRSQAQRVKSARD